MKPTLFTLKSRPPVPLEAEAISPDIVAPLTNAEIRALPLVLGKRSRRVDDFFDVEGDGSERLELTGDLSRVKWIGRGMTKGRIDVVGNAGMHLGAHMKGGAIEVTGSASDWVGAEMTGGTIRIRGDAGGQIGAAYRGSMKGMRGGVILVEGSAGMEVAMRMRRGIIVVKGAVRDFAGLQMKGGTLFLLGGAELRTGAWMTLGTIVSLLPLKMLPTFAAATTYQPTFLSLYSRALEPLGVELPTGRLGAYERHLGDTSVPGKGEILVWQP